MQVSEVVPCGLSCSVTCGILVPEPGIEPSVCCIAGRFLTTGAPGRSYLSYLSKGHHHSSNCSKGKKTRSHPWFLSFHHLSYPNQCVDGMIPIFSQWSFCFYSLSLSPSTKHTKMIFLNWALSQLCLKSSSDTNTPLQESPSLQGISSPPFQTMLDFSSHPPSCDHIILFIILQSVLFCLFSC